MTRHALCIGINDYPETQMDLGGCVNDARDWAAELESRGFSVRLLLDEQATKQAMTDAMQAVIAGARDGDVVVITFSGHGTYVYDVAEGAPGDERDGFDEALCPHDVKTRGEPLTDDEIHGLFAQRAPGVRLLLIADSCHSGTVTREGGKRQARAMPPEVWRSAPLAAPAPRRRRPAPRASAFVAGLAEAADGPDASTLVDSDDVLLSGCMEGKGQFSYDDVLDGRRNGVFTHHALATLRQLPPQASYADWHAAIRQRLPSDPHPQTPQLVASAAGRARRVLA